jgi:hypothetical protein
MASVLSGLVALAGCRQRDDAQTLQALHAQMRKAYGHEYECTEANGDWAYVCEAVGVPVDPANANRITKRRLGAFVLGEYQGRRVFLPLQLTDSGPIPTREQAVAQFKKQMHAENWRDPALDGAPR